MSELDDKIRLEREFDSRLTALHAEMVTQFARGASTHQVPDFRVRAQDPLSSLLLSHFMKTGEVFKARINPLLPLSLRSSDAEKADIDFALSQHFQKKAPEQARIILATTNRQAQVATSVAREVESDATLVAAVAIGLFSRALRSRRGRISVFETQAAAEASKMTEAEVLLGLEPSITVRTPSIQTPVMRVWRNMGDGRVRPAHVTAGGQKVPMGQPFTVMDQQLMFPGDTSLGAEIGNTINCRCFIVYDRVGIEEARL